MDTTRYGELRRLVRSNFSATTQQLVDDAVAFAAERLRDQTRYDGSPMLDHGIGVAHIVITEIGLGRNSTLAAILHDVVRIAAAGDAADLVDVTAEIRRRFGEEVLGITVGLSNISKIHLKISKEQASNFRDLIVSYSEDPRVILIKLADRLEVMRNLRIFPRDKWRKKSWESMTLYAQIAHKLGLRTGGLRTHPPQTGGDRERTPDLHRTLSRTYRCTARPAGVQIPHQKPDKIDLLDLVEDAEAACPFRRRL